MAKLVWIQVVPHGRVHAAQRLDLYGGPLYRLPCAHRSTAAVTPVAVFDAYPDDLPVCEKPRCARIRRDELA